MTSPSSDASTSALHEPEALERYLPLVHQIVAGLARKLPANVLRDDLLAAGIYGLLDSLRKNGGHEGDAFEWYARIRIRGAVIDELRAQDWLPRRAREAQSRSTLPLVQTLVSLHDGGGIDDAIHLAMATDEPAKEIEQRSEQRALVRAIGQLPERERTVVGMHYFHGVKFKDIGAVLGVSEPRISQIHAKALDRLRALLASAA